MCISASPIPEWEKLYPFSVKIEHSSQKAVVPERAAFIDSPSSGSFLRAARRQISIESATITGFLEFMHGSRNEHVNP